MRKTRSMNTRNEATALPAGSDRHAVTGMKRKHLESDGDDSSKGLDGGDCMDTETETGDALSDPDRARRSEERWAEIYKLKECAQDLHDECKTMAADLKSFTHEVTRRGTQLGISRAGIVEQWSHCLKEKKEDSQADQAS
jgi:hypothetical protein